MTHSFSHHAIARTIGVAIVLSLAVIAAPKFPWTASANRTKAVRSSVSLASGVFYTVTGTADNTDAVIHGGTGTSGNPYQMSSLRGAILNANTVTTSASGPITISVPAGTYPLSVNNPNTPATTGTIDLPDLEIGSSFNQNTTIVGVGGTPKIQQTVGGNDVITTGFTSDGFTPQAVTLALQNLEVTGGGFSGIFTGVDNGSGRSSTTITNCNIHDNSDPFGAGGGIFNQTGNLTVDGSTFANNTASGQGGAIFFDLPNSNGSAGTFGNFIVTNSTFTNNSATAANDAAGGAILFSGPNKVENTYNITASNFVNNHANGANATGGGIGSVSAGTLHATLNRFFNNTSGGAGTAVGGQGASPIDAINNWWGCDGAAGSSGCDSAAGAGVSTDPRLDLVVTATPGCAGTAVTADFTHNSSGQPVTPNVLNGLTVSFAVVSGPAGAAVSPTSSVIGSFHATTSLTATNGGPATVSATLDNGIATLATEIDKAVAVTSNPTNQSACDGTTVSFMATASGDPEPTVQWQVSTNGGGSFSDIPSATNPVLSFTVSAAQNGNQYRAVFTNMCDTTTNTATTSAATLTVTEPPVVSTSPTNQTACDGAPVTFTAAASGSPTVQWQVSTNGGGTFSDISGATSPTLTFNATASQNGNQYRAVFTNSCGSSTTQSANLTVGTSTPTITMNGQTPSLWPPNHAYRTFNVSDFVTSAHDDCDATVNVNSVYITMVTSDEAENGATSGNTLNDIVISSDCKSIQLRAEREGGGDGRVYTIYFKVKNAIGNFTTATAKVVVPVNPGETPVDSGPHYTVTSNCP